jgi:1-acyl-sn-glycerol-3-phosphate acyltransferase
MIYRLTWVLCRVVFRVLFRRRIIGAHHVPGEGPVILASNHVSNLDPPVVATGIWRRPAFMAKEELFVHPLFGWYIRKLGAFPVRRGTADRAALKRSIEIVEEGGALVMFPEGTRSPTGELQPAEMGAGMIAYRTGAPVVPVYLDGTGRIMPKEGGFHLAKVTQIYGEPLRFTMPEGEKAGREEYEAAAEQIMAAIARLRDEHVRP